MQNLILKYNKAIPRYTSYPTAPEWSNDLTPTDYSVALKSLNKTEDVALYIHLPFCKSLCNYCGCHVIIRASNDKAQPYLDQLEKEIELAAFHLGSKRKVKQIHFGGGSPSFVSGEQFEHLMNQIFSKFDVIENAEIAIEADPRTVSDEKLELYRSLRFNRISFGVQDLNENVQIEINRIQSVELIDSLVKKCRELGFKSVNLDLIYGLPKQTVENFQYTVNEIIKINPDRIALFGYAHIPWIKKHQNKMAESDLPEPNEKLAIFLKSRELFMEAGYAPIGMDHFAKPDDELAKAFNEKYLYRNFMGYAVENIQNIIGFGISSIGKIGDAFFQNVKTLKEYESHIENSILPIDRGMILSKDDILRQYVILCLMCQFELDKDHIEEKFGIDFDDYFSLELEDLPDLMIDGLLEVDNRKIHVTQLGRFFVRNIANVFDIYYRNQVKKHRFSQSV